MGTIAAMTAQVASTVGFPTSLTAATARCTAFFPAFSGSFWWRAMFSTTTMASSTRMPIEKISANKVIRFRVKPLR